MCASGASCDTRSLNDAPSTLSERVSKFCTGSALRRDLRRQGPVIRQFSHEAGAPLPCELQHLAPSIRVFPSLPKYI